MKGHTGRDLTGALYNAGKRLTDLNFQVGPVAMLLGFILDHRQRASIDVRVLAFDQVTPPLQRDQRHIHCHLEPIRRDSVRTIWADLGIDYMIAELLLNHTPSKMDRTYIHTLADDRSREALQEYHDWLTTRSAVFAALIEGR